MLDNAKAIFHRATHKLLEMEAKDFMGTADFIQYELSRLYTTLVGKVGEQEAKKRMLELIGVN